MKTPATTKVEEWTKEEIGVGALIAANNQELNGNCALFTLAPNNKKNKDQLIVKLFQTLRSTKPIKKRTKNKSPMRFWKIVNRPLEILSWFI